jgi:hypothetical protein
MMFCNCNFHFFRGSFYKHYDAQQGTQVKYVSFDEYMRVDKVRLRWRIMLQNRMQ